ncbi:MAG TPA: Nramp family divalent metal transporter [Gemmatimonadales bacterium]
MSRLPDTPSSPEARSGLPPWKVAELPVAPDPRGIRGWVGAVGPGVILLGAAIGSGEFLLGPAVVVKHGLSLLWIAGCAVILQTLFNTELMRYTLATGEPVFTGFMRTKPHSTFWGWVYSLLYLLQFGWPAWAGTAAGAAFFMGTKRLAQPSDAHLVYLCGVGLYLVCVAVLLVGRRIERTLEILNWVLVTVVLSGLLILALLFAPGETWLAAAAGYAGYDLAASRFEFVPTGADWFLLGAFAGFSGAGGVANITLANWARDKGYGMGQVAGFIPAAIGGKKVNLAHTGYRFEPTAEAMVRWKGWWRLVRADQYGVFFVGAILGMLLPATLYVTFLEPGRDIRGLGVAAELAHAIAGAKGPIFGGVVAVTAVWILFKTQLDLLEATVRSITDILWTGSARIRAFRGGDVRVIYYGVLFVAVAWGMIALRLAQPVFLLQLAANIGGLIFVLGSLHLLYINTTLLPPALRPPLWRRVALVAMAVFYGVFATMWLASL